MTNDAERCQRCQQLIRPGATFCPACGAPLSNRAARNERNIDHSQRELMERAAAQGSPIPGSIPVAQARAEAARPAIQGGGTGMGGKLDLIPAAAGRRLGAAVLDWVGPAAVLVVMLTLGFASVTRTRSGGFIVYDTAMLVLLGSIGVGVTVIYMLVLLSIEGRSGNSIGNRLMGIRSADQDGYAPGAGALFLRGLITGAGMLLTVVAAVLVVVFQWFGAALWILGPLALLGVAWAFVVVVSNSWDRNGKLRGWHDAAAKTFMFDVNAGRNHHRRHPGSVQFRAAGSPSRAAGFVTGGGTGRAPAGWTAAAWTAAGWTAAAWTAAAAAAAGGATAARTAVAARAGQCRGRPGPDQAPSGARTDTAGSPIRMGAASRRRSRPDPDARPNRPGTGRSTANPAG
jgi:uncharacterized RDD family membrane protein YckC